jgi:hypothetical protein
MARSKRQRVTGPPAPDDLAAEHVKPAPFIRRAEAVQGLPAWLSRSGMSTVLDQPFTRRRRRQRQAWSLTEDRERALADRVAAKTDRHRLVDVPLSSSEREARTSASHAPSNG